MFNFTGFLLEKKETKKVSEKFQVREFIITDRAEKYPQTIMFQLYQERCELIDNINVGDKIVIHFEIRGREWKNKEGKISFYNTLGAFKIEKKGNSNSKEIPISKEVEDNLPF